MAKFLELLLAAPEVKPLLSSEHFSVDGTLLRAWASHSSLERLDGLDNVRHHRVLAKGFAALPPARIAPKVTSAACCSPTRPTAPGATARPACSRRLLALLPSCASWGTASWRTAMAWWSPVRSARPAAPLSGIQRLMAAPHATWAMPNRSTPGSGSNRCLAGSNRQQGCGSSRPEADRRWERCSGCMWWPTT